MSVTVDRRFSYIVGAGAIAVGAGILLGFAGGLPPGRTPEFCALILTSILTAAVPASPRGGSNRAAAAVEFVVLFASLLLFGAHATLLVGAASFVTRRLSASEDSQATLLTALDAATILAATQAAGLALQARGATARRPGNSSGPRTESRLPLPCSRTPLSRRRRRR
jgi:hypothetical protein